VRASLRCKQLKGCIVEMILEQQNRKKKETDVSWLADSRRAGDVSPLIVFATAAPCTASNLTTSREEHKSVAGEARAKFAVPAAVHSCNENGDGLRVLRY